MHVFAPFLPEKDPPGHSEQMLVPFLAANVPGAHLTQVFLDVAEYIFDAVPGGHTLHTDDLVAPILRLNVPSGHRLQNRCPSSILYIPFGHIVQVALDVAPNSEDEMPIEHLRH